MLMSVFGYEDEEVKNMSLIEPLNLPLNLMNIM